MTIKELADISAVSIKTARQKINTIPGIVRTEDGEYEIPEGSRYPYDVHRYKLDSIGKRCAALLDATYRYRFVDHEILKMPRESFETLIQELLGAGLLRRNGSLNRFGANRYDTTLVYEMMSTKKTNNRIKAIADVIGSASGHFAGALASETLVL